MKSKSLIAGGLLVASLALEGNAAMAANIASHKHIVRHAPATARMVQPSDPFIAGFGPFMQSMFGGQMPVRYAGSRPDRSSGPTESFNSGPTVDTSASDAQSALDTQVQAQQALNDENALNDSMAAAEAQNEAAQAAAIQTEINANN
jgi:hypothetical protein